MLRSMTGYGRAADHFNGLDCSVEIRSVNSRFQDISIHLPRSISFLELPLREQIQKSGFRGKIICSVNLSGDLSVSSEFVLNEQLLESYLSVSNELKTRFGLPGEISVYTIMNRQDVVSLAEKKGSEEQFSGFVTSLLAGALESMNEMQETEGGTIRELFVSLLEGLAEKNRRVESMYKTAIQEFIDRFTQRVSQLLNSDMPSPEALNHEIVILGDKLDISEEISRLASHLDQFRTYMDSDDSAVGKKLNFLLQEMNREATTMGNKANNSTISYLVVEMKNEIEMLREQVQNLQ